VGNLTFMGIEEITNNFAVIGDPVDQSLSPILHNEAFQQLGLDAYYSKLNIPQKKLSLEKLKKLYGFNVTIPHKTEIIKFLNVINPRATEIGAVNCVFKKNNQFWGFNTDWFGFSMALKRNYIDLKNKSILVLGAGGVAYSVLYSLIQENVKKIFIKNRTILNAEKLIEHFKFKIGNIDVMNFENAKPKNSDIDIIVNCTSLGMKPNETRMAINEGFILKKHTVIDTIYNPVETLLLKKSNEKRAKTLNGLDMFIYQGLASLDIWFGENVSQKLDFNKIKEKLLIKLC